MKVRIQLFSIGLCLASLIIGLAYAGDYVVTDTSIAEYTVGQTLADNAIIKLPMDGKLVVLVVDEGETKTLVGPYVGPISEYDAHFSGDIDTIMNRILNGNPRSGDCGSVEGVSRDSC